MNKERFIRLHNAENNTVVVINIKHIALIDTDEVNERIVSVIYLENTCDVKEFNVNETPEKIYTMIEEIQK
jgi:hypothetical protein